MKFYVTVLFAINLVGVAFGDSAEKAPAKVLHPVLPASEGLKPEGGDAAQSGAKNEDPQKGRWIQPKDLPSPASKPKGSSSGATPFTAICKNAQGVTFKSSDEGYRTCVQEVGRQGANQGSIDSNERKKSNKITPGNEAGVQFKIGN